MPTNYKKYVDKGQISHTFIQKHLFYSPNQCKSHIFGIKWVFFCEKICIYHFFSNFALKFKKHLIYELSKSNSSRKSDQIEQKGRYQQSWPTFIPYGSNGWSICLPTRRWCICSAYWKPQTIVISHAPARERDDFMQN